MDIGLLISKALGFAIVGGSLILQVPQILKIINAKSVAGLSLASFWLQVVGFTITLAYNYNLAFPFSTYGESLFILIQDVFLVVLLYHYRRRINLNFYLALFIYSIFAYSVLSGLVGLSVLQLLQAATIPIFSASRVPQIYSNFSNKSVGQLSFVTTILNLGGNVGRVFTTLKEVNDPIILAGCLIGTLLNGIIVLQFLLYWNAKPKKRV